VGGYDYVYLQQAMTRRCLSWHELRDSTQDASEVYKTVDLLASAVGVMCVEQPVMQSAVMTATKTRAPVSDPDTRLMM
jgi:hypothetical protein